MLNFGRSPLDIWRHWTTANPRLSAPAILQNSPFLMRRVCLMLGFLLSIFDDIGLLNQIWNYNGMGNAVECTFESDDVYSFLTFISSFRYCNKDMTTIEEGKNGYEEGMTGSKQALHQQSSYEKKGKCYQSKYVVLTLLIAMTIATVLTLLSLAILALRKVRFFCLCVS